MGTSNVERTLELQDGGVISVRLEGELVVMTMQPGRALLRLQRHEAWELAEALDEVSSRQ